MRDVNTRADLELILGQFYSALLKDNGISYIFTDVAKIDLERHLPHIIDFWEQSVFGNNGYRKNVMQIHLDLNNKERLSDNHFALWLSYFETTVDSLFQGSNADKLKTRALSIATVMKIKLQH